MPSSAHLTAVALLALSPLAALAKTDLSGCTTFTSTVTIDPTSHEYGNVYESLVYYDPDTLEICTVPDCGGGRAAPKTGVPGCPLYSGTATAAPSFLSADPLAPSTTSSVAAETTTSTAGSSPTVLVSTRPDGSASADAPVTWVSGTGSTAVTFVSGGVQATGSASTSVTGGSTGAASGTASASSGSVDASAGAVTKVALGGLSVALGLAAAIAL
ncbi:hypothetical protein N8I77_005323 [Diaporthe amygdali]|uniref:Siderophore biosynthesis n=1 Tax=Phomopsis amygdali TaxID=1214568 RepID=A0AAD9SFQ1_PHOAM|nr:hypothetical protein N8I77_005323 [Diaporthe amygdali]